eukprot:3429253-Rhodomonas_salina.3
MHSVSEGLRKKVAAAENECCSLNPRLIVPCQTAQISSNFNCELSPLAHSASDSGIANLQRGKIPRVQQQRNSCSAPYIIRSSCAAPSTQHDCIVKIISSSSAYARACACDGASGHNAPGRSSS